MELVSIPCITVTVVTGTVSTTATHSERSGSVRRASTTARTTAAMAKQLRRMVAISASPFGDNSERNGKMSQPYRVVY